MKGVLDWFESLPLPVTTGIIIAASVVFALACVPIRARRAKWAAAIIGPFVVAGGIYWMPVWLGADSSEYAAWATLFLVVWGVPGALASSIVVFVSEKLDTRQGRE